MTKALVEIELPEGLELAEPAVRCPRKGELYLADDGYPKTAGMDFAVSKLSKFPILRHAWQWPEWLTAEWLFMQPDLIWFASNAEPVLLNGSCWHYVGVSIDLRQEFFAFNPPPCDHWTNSKRRNPRFLSK